MDLMELKNLFLNNGSYKNETLTGDPNFCRSKTELHLAANVIAIFLAIFIIIGNTLVLLVLNKNSAKTFTPINWLLCHLAISDFLIGITVLWWYGIAEIFLVETFQMTKLICYGFAITSVVCSFSGLMMISIDRYLLLLRNRKYHKMLSKKRLIFIIALMWILPITCFIIAPAAGWSCVKECDCRIHNIYPTDIYCFDDKCSQIFPPLTKLLILITCVACLSLLTVTIILYIVMFYKARNKLNDFRHIRSLPKNKTSSIKAKFHSNGDISSDKVSCQSVTHQQNASGRKTETLKKETEEGVNSPCIRRRTNEVKGKSQKKTNHRREIRLMKSMFIIISVFAVTSVPCILFLLYSYFDNDRHKKEAGNILLQITTINSLLNPFLYFWRIPSMRKNLLRIFRCDRKNFKFSIRRPSALRKILRLKTLRTPQDNAQGVVEENLSAV